MSNRFQEFFREFGIKHHFNAVVLHIGNGQVERYNKTVLDSLATMGADWDDDQ